MLPTTRTALWLLLTVLLSGCAGMSAKSPIDEVSEPPVEEKPESKLSCPEPVPCICPVCPPPAKEVRKPESINDKKVIGELEVVTLHPDNFNYAARIDTGATTTSIHATNIQRFERDGERWVRYTLYNPKTGEPVVRESEQIRRIRIINAEEGFDSRRVVMMVLSIGNIKRQVEVSLVDRSDLTYPILIGRNFLVDTFVVDVSQRHTTK